MSYNGRGGSSYGQSRRGSGFHFGKGKKKKKEDDIYEQPNNRADSNESTEPASEEQTPEPEIPQDNIDWTPRPLPLGTKIVLSTPTTFTSNGVKALLSNDLAVQDELGFRLALLAESRPLDLEAFELGGQSKKFRVIKTSSQKPEDKPLSLVDMVLVGNLRNGLQKCGYTIIER